MKNCAFCGIAVSMTADQPKIVYGGGSNLDPRVVHGSCYRAFEAFVGNA